MKKKIIYLALFILFISVTNSYALPLKLEISVNQDSLKEDYSSKLGMFEVFYKIKNISDKKQDMTVWTGCSGWSWTSNQPEIIPGAHSCINNAPYKITLKPNEEYKGTLLVFFSTKLKTGPMTFRLGFYPHAGVGEIKSEADIKGTIWSNGVTITIEPWMLQKDVLR